MKNKLTIIGVIVVVAGAILFFGSSGSIGGSKTLTRNKAAKMIKTYLQATPPSIQLDTYVYDKDAGHFSITFLPEKKKIEGLEAAGMVKIIPQEENKNSWPPPLFNLHFDFTEKAKPYLIKKEQNPIIPTTSIILAEVDDVKVTGINSGMNANYTAKYKLTPVGKIVNEWRVVQNAQLAGKETNGTASFSLYDDGWRIFGAY